MSDSSLVELFTQLKLSNYFTTASSCLVLYEYLITLGGELSAVWSKKASATSILLISIRWTMALSAILALLAPGTQMGCKAVGIVIEFLLIVSFLQISLVSTLRVYALLDRNILISIFVATISLTPVATNMLVVYKSLDLLWISASTLLLPFQIKQIQFLYVTRGSAVLADGVILIVTWIKTFHVWREGRRLNIPQTLSSYLLKDGTVYFIALLAINVTQIGTSTGDIAYISSLLATLPLVLINRFLLNLRALNIVQGDHQSDLTGDATQMSSVGFRAPDSFLGDIGGTVPIGEAVQHRDAELHTTGGPVYHNDSEVLGENLDYSNKTTPEVLEENDNIEMAEMVVIAAA